MGDVGCNFSWVFVGNFLMIFYTDVFRIGMSAVAGQLLFGITLYGRNADALYYFTYVEGDKALFMVYSLFIIIPSIIGADCFPIVFRLTNNKGRSASIFALWTGISMFCMYFFKATESPVWLLVLRFWQQIWESVDMWQIRNKIRRFLVS